MSSVGGEVAQIFLGLDIVDAVGLWVVKINGVDGEGKVGTLAIFAGCLDVEADVLAKLLWLEVGWVEVTLLYLKLVLTALVRAIDIISLISLLVDKITRACDSRLLTRSHLLDCNLPAFADLVMSKLECCWTIIDSLSLDSLFASLLRVCLPVNDCPLVHLAEGTFLGHALLKLD